MGWLGRPREGFAPKERSLGEGDGGDDRCSRDFGIPSRKHRNK